MVTSFDVWQSCKLLCNCCALIYRGTENDGANTCIFPTPCHPSIGQMAPTLLTLFYFPWLNQFKFASLYFLKKSSCINYILVPIFFSQHFGRNLFIWDVCERTINMFTAAEIGLMCSQFCKFDGTLEKLERVYEEDRVWEWYHAINKLILFCIYTAEASLRINMWPSRLLMAHIQYTEKRSIFFHLNVELENRETERKL